VTGLAALGIRPGDPGRVRAFDLVRWALGLLLVAAGILKAHQLATEPVANRDIFSYRWSLTAQVYFELIFGVWLLSGLHKRLTWLTAVGCFLFFSGVTVYKALSGAATCGCFGKVDVNPWYTLILDVSAVAALLIFRPDLSQRTTVRHYRPRLAAATALSLASCVPAGLAMASYKPATLTAGGEAIGESRFVILEPAKWVGKPFPLLRYIDIGERLSEGKWVVLLHRDGCPDCAEAKTRYRWASADLMAERGIGVAFVGLPRSAKAHGRAPVGSDAAVAEGELSADDREWFVTTPAVACLRDGLVQAAWEGKAPQMADILHVMTDKDRQDVVRQPAMPGVAGLRDPYASQPCPNLNFCLTAHGDTHVLALPIAVMAHFPVMPAARATCFPNGRRLPDPAWPDLFPFLLGSPVPAIRLKGACERLVAAWPGATPAACHGTRTAGRNDLAVGRRCATT